MNKHSFLKSLHLCIFCVIILSKRSFSAHYQYESCTQKNCENGPNITFPFYVGSLQDSYCGYPGFELTCKDGFPVLDLPGNEFVVEHIFYSNRSLRVYNAAVLLSNDTTCLPLISRNTTLPITRFDFVNETGLHLFSKCKNLSEGLSRYYVGCGGNEDGNNGTFALYDDDENLSDAMEGCEENVVVPVEVHGDERRINNGVVNVEEVLRKGFVMNWTASDCRVCEESGGRCGFNESSFHFRCFCPDRPHSRSCKPADSKCQQSFQCGKFSFEFPFSDNENPECGLFMVDGCESDYPRIHRRGEDLGYSVVNQTSSNKLFIRDPMLEALVSNHSCLSFTNMFLLKSASVSFTFSPNLTLFSCINHSYSEPIDKYFHGYDHIDCRNPSVYYNTPVNDVPVVRLSDIPPECSEIQLPRYPDRNSGELFNMLSAEFFLEWNVSEPCLKCYSGGGQCLTANEGDFYCKKDKSRLVLILAISLPGAGVLLLLLVVFMIWQRKKKTSRNYLLRNISSSPSSKSDIEGGSFYFGIPVFSYSELEETTGNFDPCNELGDGGFGTVYYGKLRDGREVAIKRLYEHNYRRVEQFLNEIKILTGLRHPNLVSLYGCTSRRSRELLLVYEYISNGTVAEHLHGDRAKESPLTWPVRMSIAIETATALAYLHNSDIIHRDVKTNNILLDSNCHVKVADFGLSRLFPIDVTHISTAPQGTPGYVDPEYHQCYQLTDKSDVYSFGVVLIELISSMPAVDISRHRHEINLANLALNRIQRCAFDELIDPSLGYDSDPEVARMATSVAELAFRCLQLEKDMRPAMDEVVASLKDIQGGEDCNDPGKIPPFPGKIPPSPETDDVSLLMSKKFQPSPNAVTDRWASSGSTTTSSIG